MYPRKNAKRLNLKLCTCLCKMSSLSYFMSFVILRGRNKVCKSDCFSGITMFLSLLKDITVD